MNKQKCVQLLSYFLALLASLLLDFFNPELKQIVCSPIQGLTKITTPINNLQPHAID